MLSPTILRHLTTLRCPLTEQPLTVLAAEELEDINRQLQAGERLHRDGTAAPIRLSDAVGTVCREQVYRIEEDILWMLPDMALVPAGAASSSGLNAEKRTVQSFYNDFGWVKTPDGLFNDTAEFTVARTIARDYNATCNARIAGQLTAGTSLLDAASGAIPHPEYLGYSDNFEVRICVDFSIRALREARGKLGERGLYVLADITRLPFATGGIDAVMSLHTIYHIPKLEQTRAIDELMRVCRPGGRVVIVYSWATSLAMDAVFRVRGFLGTLRRFGRPPSFAANSSAGAAAPHKPDLYFHPQNYDWFKREIASKYPARIRVWSAVSMMFQIRFFPQNVLGRATAGIVKTIENVFPALAGRFGQYPMFILEKDQKTKTG